MKSYLPFALAITLFLPVSRLIAQSEMAETIAMDLFYASGQISNQRPSVTITSGLDLPVRIDPESFSLQVDEKTLALCNSAADSQDAMASILAPAIVQLYTSAFRDTLISQGAFFGYMAGYQTLGEPAAALWANLYRAYPKLSEEIDLETRKSLMDNARQELDQFIPVFQMANYFSVVGQYGYAEIYYEKIKARFPSREIYSNAGVCKALQALDLFGINELKYVYPFVIDLKFRAGTKGEKSMRDSLLLAAAEDFREAIRRDPAYAIGYVNLSCTQSLLKDYSEAIANAKRAQELAEAQNLNRVKGSALIALGIAYAESGEKLQSDAAFSTAADIEDESVQKLVKLNQQEAVASGEEKTFFDEESIGSSTVESMAGEIIYGGGLQQPFYVIPVGKNTNLYVKEEPQYRLIIQKNSADKTNWFFQSSQPGYEGASAGEIQLGSDITEVTDAYGDPATVRKFGRGKFYYYKKSGIIFKINADDAVEGWTLFYDN